jgi:hypothetical protein
MPQNLREKFQNNRLEAANKYLSNIADNFEEKMTNPRIVDAHSPNAFVYFDDPCLRSVTKAEVFQMEGFEKLKRVCSAPAVDMAIGPNVYDCKYLFTAMHALPIYVAKSYAESGFLNAEKTNAKKVTPMRRAWNRLTGRRQNPPRVTTTVLTPGPGLT